MRKFTFGMAALVVAGVALADGVPSQLMWYGDGSRIWNLTQTNWISPTNYDPSFVLSDVWIPASQAVFNDSVFADTCLDLKVDGSIETAGVLFRSSKDFIINKTASTDNIFGNGSLIMRGTGSLTMDVLNKLSGPTIIENGTLAKKAYNSPNIFGDSLILKGGVADFGNDSKNSATITGTSIYLVPGSTAAIELPRYCYFGNKISGQGTLNLNVGGERTALGAAKNVSAVSNLSNFEGTINIVKDVESGIGSGFYGLMLNTDKTWNDTVGIDSTFYKDKVHIGAGAGIYAESGTRCYAIGELSAEDSTSFLAGYYKKSNSPRIYYMVGGLNTDVTYPGTFADKGEKGYNAVSIIKVGTGSYVFTSNNTMSQGEVNVINIKEGSLFFNTDEKQINATTFGRSKGIVFHVGTGTVGGGNGRLTGQVKVEGTLQVGYQGIGTIVLADTVGSTGIVGGYSYPLNLQPSSTTEFEIASASSYDKIDANCVINYNADDTSKPQIKVSLLIGATINKGDEFTLIKSTQPCSTVGQYDITLPALSGGLKWVNEEHNDTILTPVTLKDVNGADSIANQTSYSYELKLRVGDVSDFINNLDASSVSVYPTISNGDFEITSGEILNSVKIFNLQGQLIKSLSANGNSVDVNISGVSSGIYFVKIESNGGVITKKIQIK
jgi:hypothetical protein